MRAAVRSMPQQSRQAGAEADPLRPVRIWLYGIAALVFAMVIVGGATRLTDSGLSITEWQPILGAIPPLTEVDWLVAFDKYRQIPEYKLINKGMSLAAFKTIYWWEWGHRFLGRFIGVAFFLPFLYFVARGTVRGALALKLFGIFLLGGLQGAIGWYMVQSGLVDRIDVSQYRLALHLLVAALILVAVLWVAIAIEPGSKVAHLRTITRSQRRLAALLLGLVLLQVALGALVAGMKAGLAYNTWPLMDGQILPRGLFAMSPRWANLFENALTVQFNHRVVAYVITVLALVHWVSLRPADDERVRRASAFLAASVLAQVGLGIWTLLAHVPLSLALAHQGLGFVVLALATLNYARLSRAT